MPLYRYIKEKKSVKRRIVSFTSYLMLILGSVVLFWSFFPLISFELYSRIFVAQRTLEPVPHSSLATSLVNAQTIDTDEKSFSTNLSDYTHAGVWFPKVKKNISDSEINLKEYSLSIPKLDIKGAKVIVGGDDLKNSLIHYLPKTKPGEFGNISIFGHSTLPQLWKPGNDYLSIFTYLPSLERGDEVLVDVKDLRYKYKIYEMFVVTPDEVSVLDQKYDNAYLTLVTCVPPGTYWKRLVVRAKLDGI